MCLVRLQLQKNNGYSPLLKLHLSLYLLENVQVVSNLLEVSLPAITLNNKPAAGLSQIPIVCHDYSTKLKVLT